MGPAEIASTSYISNYLTRRGIGYSFQLAITAFLYSIIDYCINSAQSKRLPGDQLGTSSWLGCKVSQYQLDSFFSEKFQSPSKKRQSWLKPVIHQYWVVSLFVFFCHKIKVFEVKIRFFSPVCKTLVHHSLFTCFIVSHRERSFIPQLELLSCRS